MRERVRERGDLKGRLEHARRSRRVAPLQTSSRWSYPIHRGYSDLQWKSGPREVGHFSRRGFSIYVDNLPKSMCNVWMKQLFQNEGGILDVFVSNKKRKHKELKFGFVRFTKEEEAQRAITRNNGLMIKGNPIKVSWAKYPSLGNTKQHETKEEKKHQKQTWKKVWRPANRDHRSYKDIVQKLNPIDATKINNVNCNKFTSKTLIEVSSDEVLEDWLNQSMICYYHKGFSVRKSMEEMVKTGIEHLIFSRFDSVSYIISRRSNSNITRLDENTISTLKKCFAKVIPWSRDIKQIITRKFEIIGIPIHLWSDENIMKIGSCIGEVKEIHFTKRAFDAIEISININVNDDCTFQKVIGLKADNKIYNVYIHEVESQGNEAIPYDHCEQTLTTPTSHEVANENRRDNVDLLDQEEEDSPILNSESPLANQEGTLIVPTSPLSMMNFTEEIQTINNKERESDDTETSLDNSNTQEETHSFEARNHREELAEDFIQVCVENVVMKIVDKVADRVVLEEVAPHEDQTALNTPGVINSLELHPLENEFLDLFSTAWAQGTEHNSTPEENTHTETIKRRGRPKKQRWNQEIEKKNNDKSEARRTWNIGAAIGMTTKDEEGILTILRRSQRNKAS